MFTNSRSLLLEMSAFADLLLGRIPLLQQEWTERRAALVATGTLPDAARSPGADRS